MSEPSLNDYFIFEANGGGLGVRFSVTTTSSQHTVPRPDQTWDRLLISNSSSTPAYVLIGQGTVTASTNCMEILPGTQVLVRIPVVQTAPEIAAVTESGTTSLSAIVGKGI